MLLVLLGVVLCAVACDGPSEPDDPILRADFSACEPGAVVPLDSVPNRELHPDFSILTPTAIGDSLAAVDHGIAVDADNRLHCFWTRGRGWDNGVSFGHASSADLIEWELHPSIVLSSDTHVIDRVWAPQVFYADGVWQMYFTGVELAAPLSANRQRIFLATSDDLFEWSNAKVALEPRHELTAWGDGIPFADDARDQVVFRSGGKLQMILTIRLPNGSQSLALAERTGGIWSVTDVLTSIQDENVESPAIYAVDGQPRIVTNNWRETGQALWTADSLTGEWTRDPAVLRGFGWELIALDGGYTIASRVWGSSVMLTRIDLSDLSADNMVFPDCYTGTAPLLPASTPVWDMELD